MDDPQDNRSSSDGEVPLPLGAASAFVSDSAARILESITDAFFALDAQWRFTYVNDQADKIMSKGRDQVMGRVYWDVFPATLDTAFDHEYRRAVSENTPVSFETYYPPLAAWLEVRAFPAPDGGLSVFFQNVTARRRDEEARRDGERRFRALADNITQLAWMAGGDGAIFWYNQRWLDYTGASLEEMVGWGWRTVHHPDYVEPVTQRFRAHVRAGQAWEDTFPLRGRDGTFRWFLSRAAPVRDDQGAVVLWCGTNTDVTEQREAEAALREAAERQKVLLREVLASVTGGTLRLVEAESELPAALSNGAPPIPLTRESGLRALREQVKAAASALEFPIERCHDLVTAASEGGMNAVMHGGERGEARVSSGETDTVQVRVQDWGMGISAQDLPRATLSRGWSTATSLGHGLAMILQSIDRLWLLTGPSGTTVVMEQDRQEPLPTWL